MTQVGLERAILRLRTERGDLCAAQQIDNFYKLAHFSIECYSNKNEPANWLRYLTFGLISFEGYFRSNLLISVFRTVNYLLNHHLQSRRARFDVQKFTTFSFKTVQPIHLLSCIATRC